MTRRIQGVIGLVGMLALAVGLPWALTATIGNPLDQWSSIRSGDMSDRDVIAIMAAVTYLAWASFAIALLVELTASLVAAVTRRPRRVVRLPLLGVQQDLARTLIAAVLLLAPAVISVVGPATSAFASPPPSVSVSVSDPPRPRRSSRRHRQGQGRDRPRLVARGDEHQHRSAGEPAACVLAVARLGLTTRATERSPSR
jgi:hypothetical protein